LPTEDLYSQTKLIFVKNALRFAFLNLSSTILISDLIFILEQLIPDSSLIVSLFLEVIVIGVERATPVFV